MSSSNQNASQLEGILRIVFCCFSHDDFLQEAFISIESLRCIGKFKGNITLVTEFTNVQNKMIDDIIIVETPTNKDLGPATRLRILDLINYNSNDVILYLDTDVLCVGEMDFFIEFSKTIDNNLHVYGYEETCRIQKEKTFAARRTNDESILDQVAWCSGILLFRPSIIIKESFQKAYSHYKNHLKTYGYDGMWEQPSLCIIFCENRKYKTSLDPFVYEERVLHNFLKGKSPSLHPNINHIFNHFCGLRGSDRNKKMRKILNSFIKNMNENNDINTIQRDIENTTILYTREQLSDLCRPYCSPNQMSLREYVEITHAINQRSPCNVLIYGLGNDSELYMKMNPKGINIFIETDIEWIKKASKKIPVDNIIHHVFQTSVEKSLQNKCTSPYIFSNYLHLHDWDVIIVDAPKGWCNDMAGREIPIRESSSILKKTNSKVDVFVHDVDRPLEKMACDKYFPSTASKLTYDRTFHFKNY